MPIEEEMVFTCSLADADRARAVAMLFILSKEAMQREVAKDYWNQKLAVSAPNLLRVLYSETVVEKMRKELRALTGYRSSTQELRDLLETQIVRPDLAGQARKVARRSAARPKKQPPALEEASALPALPPPSSPPASLIQSTQERGSDSMRDKRLT
jgi:hypothetical protein